MALRPVDVVGIVKGYMLETQAYCEAKLHYMIMSKRQGAGVEEGLARKLVEETLKLLRRPRGMGVEFVRIPIYAMYNGVFLSLSPDAIVYVDGAVAGLMEARIRANMRYYDSDFLVLEVAGLLVEEILGVELYNLKLILLVASDTNSLRNAIEDTRGNPFKPWKSESWLRVVRLYDRGSSLNKLLKLLEYWLGIRSFKPNPSPSKCRVCEYRDQCPSRFRE